MKKALTLVFVFCLLLCVAACGNEQALSESTDSAAQSATENDAQENTTTTQKANDVPTTTGNNKTTSNRTTSGKATTTTAANKTTTTQTTTTATPLAKAQAAIKAKDYETAYSILFSIKNRSKEEEALFKRFAFQPIEKLFDQNRYKTTYTYDKNGYLIKERCDYDDSYTEIVYTNDSRGNKIKEQRSWSYGSSGEDIKTYTYDSNNNLLTIISNNDVENSKTVNRYDSNNRIIETIHTTDYYIQYKMTYTYDKNGFLASAKYNDLDSDDSATIIYTCDKSGNITARNVTGTVDSETMWIKDKATYNSNGDLLTLEFTDSYGTHTKITRTYDENGYIKKIVREDSENGSSTTNIVCDMYGNIVSDGDGSTTYKLFYYPNGSPIRDTPDYNNDYFYNIFYL